LFRRAITSTFNLLTDSRSKRLAGNIDSIQRQCLGQHSMFHCSCGNISVNPSDALGLTMTPPTSNAATASTAFSVIIMTSMSMVTVPLLLPHQLFGTACRRRCGHPYRCSCSGVGSSLSFSGVPWAQDTPRDFILVVT